MSLGNTAKEILSTGVISDEVQEIQMTESDGGYTPNIFHIKPNMKTRWIIHAINPYTCASQLVAPAIRVQKQLNQGENSIEFISPTSGNIRFSCSMGMYTGEIIIDNDRSDPALSSPSSQTIKTPDVVTNSGYSCSTGTRVKK
jgi:plastocyanin domain-containing protein